MIIRLIPPPPHPTILYGVTFPPVLSLHDLGPGAAMPVAWSSQLQILTSVLQLEPPSSVHLLDRAVGLVARVHEVTMDVQQKEFVLKFIDGRMTSVPMNSDCVRILLGVVVDVKGCSEPESQRNSMEGSACAGSTSCSADGLPPGGSPTKSSKPGKHKRQRSFLFSLISLFVPKSISPSSPSLPSSAPPPTPLPPIPVSSRMTSPTSLGQADLTPEHPDFLRRRARATLVDVWRRHVVSVLGPQHVPATGYIEWILIAMASKARAEIESAVANSHGCAASSTRAGGSKHRKTQSESRNALDFGDRSDDYESEQWRCRAPSPFPGALSAEDTDRVVYPRREQADEWGVRYVHHSGPIDEVDIFAVEYDGHNDNLLGEHFTIGDDWDDTERLTYELSRIGRHSAAGTDGHLSNLHPGDFIFDCSDDYGSRLSDSTFDVSRCPLMPSDVNDDEQSDDSQMSLRTPEDGEDLPLTWPLQSRSPQNATSAPQPPSRVNSSRPRSRNVSAQFSSVPSTPSTRPSSTAHHLDYRNIQDDELITSGIAYLDRVSAAIEIVRGRAREEGWRLVRATSIGAKIGWMDAEAERSLETRAKRRAWSSGIKISAPYSIFRFASKAWNDGSSTSRSPIRPPGLSSSKGILRVRGPIVPTGLSLGVPERSSPLAMYAWSADDGQKCAPSKYGILSSGHSMETREGKRSSRVTFADNVTKLFPVCEDDGEDLFEPVQVNAVGFPQEVPECVAAEEPEYSLASGPTGKGDDPFCFCPSQPRTRTTSMYMISPTSLAPSPPVLPMFRPSTPPPSYQAAVGDETPASGSCEEGRLDASALLLQPLSSLSVSSPQSASRPSLVSNPPFIPRPRAVSLPTPRSYANTNKTRRTSLHHKDEHCEDLSQEYASPPPEGPLIISATPAPHEQYPRYAHVQPPIPTSKKNMSASILGRTSKEVVFEQAGSEFTVGIEVALGRAEEGRVVW